MYSSPGEARHHNDLFRRLLAPRIPAIAEFGCYNGGTTRFLAEFGLPVWAFDTFTGIPPEDYDPKLDYSDPPGKWVASAAPEVLFEGYPNIIPIKGRFADTLPLVPKEVRFALVHIDCDLYASYKQVLDWLPDHLTPCAAIVCDDYGHCDGATKAVDEFLRSQYFGVTFDKQTQTITWPGHE
jgi:hypothetical protein